jgi:hypothetical protein
MITCLNTDDAFLVAGNHFSHHWFLLIIDGWRLRVIIPLWDLIRYVSDIDVEDITNIVNRPVLE